MSATSQDGLQDQASSFYAALARTATRSLALYFSRPVRLFRPSKVNGWQSLKNLALHHGRELSPHYISWLVRQQGFMVIPKHFIPPMVVNGALGFVLWSTYTEVSNTLEPHLQSSPILLAAISGASAGGMQALVAAPAENVRLAFEGGSTSAQGWSHAWKEVFRGTQKRLTTSGSNKVHEARQVRDWMREVGEMAGRGWDGWGWGFAKDICGFSVFFSIFEITRRAAAQTKLVAQKFMRPSLVRDDMRETRESMQRHVPRIVHAITLVFGGAIAGLAYELTCRPWDIARKTMHISRVAYPADGHSVTTVLLDKLRHDGLLSFFEDPAHALHYEDTSSSPMRRRLHSASRTLARVGPWGVGFLVWEAFGPGLS
ncbi:uncharacterized protein LAESUDRAFT_720506 [Laetiporus sulphureus 93-53]|uniref:Mitochondrial carrier n=1 Tax=Laetiporus sulphureus 93-53 TaxID=1314785 RepID=A0A165H617_9APHY|nr:uncharacterized protein LAESUDRAFT_720506 [Laetiporus sulphureus 93-53]KZT11292.1 hypothetical protein LAESUDRAFT_720506 [Laetiporus sulphureus 93-53]